MNNNEFINEFDLLYDAGSKGAPSIDNYEKSLYLTIAQEELVKSFYSGRNPDKKAFENTEKRRRALNELVKPYTQTTQIEAPGIGFDSRSVFYAIPDVFYIIVEKAKYRQNVGTKGGYKFVEIPVIPITHDEYLYSKENPFRKPNNRKAWRMDLSKQGSNNIVEIISSRTLTEYSMRYVEKPKPIIVTNIAAGSFEGLGLTIDGVTEVSQCLLNSEIHRDIVNRASELAIRDFRESSLQSKIATNGRV